MSFVGDDQLLIIILIGICSPLRNAVAVTKL